MSVDSNVYYKLLQALVSYLFINVSLVYSLCTIQYTMQYVLLKFKYIFSALIINRLEGLIINRQKEQSKLVNPTCNVRMRRTSVFIRLLRGLDRFCQSLKHSFCFTAQKTTFGNICAPDVRAGYGSRMPRTVYILHLDPSGSLFCISLL